MMDEIVVFINGIKLAFEKVENRLDKLEKLINIDMRSFEDPPPDMSVVKLHWHNGEESRGWYDPHEGCWFLYFLPPIKNPDQLSSIWIEKNLKGWSRLY